MLNLNKTNKKSKDKSTFERSRKIFNRVLISLAALIGIMLLTSLGFYIGYFNDGIIKDQQIWGSFGSYFNGFMSPFISISGFIAVLITVKIGFEKKEDEEKIYKIGMYIDAMKKIEEEIDITSKKIVWRDIPMKDPSLIHTPIYNNLRTISNMFRFLYRWLYEIKKMDNDNPFIYQISEKYSGIVEKLIKNEWIRSDELLSFFQQNSIQNIYTE